MKEREFLREVSRIARESSRLHEAVSGIQLLVSREIGVATFLIRPADGNHAVFRDPMVTEFLESRAFPFRGVYKAHLGSSAVIIICLGSWGAPGKFTHQMVDRIGQELTRWMERNPSQAWQGEAA